MESDTIQACGGIKKQRIRITQIHRMQQVVAKYYIVFL